MCRGCCGGDSGEGLAYWMEHSVKKELLRERVREKIQKKYGKDIDSLAGAIVEFNEAGEKDAGEAEKELEEKFDKVFGWDEE